MKIEYQDIITLDDDNKYLVASIAIYNDNEYLYLVDINNHQNIKIAETSKDNSISILNNDEQKLISILLPLFYENSKEDLVLEKVSEN